MQLQLTNDLNFLKDRERRHWGSTYLKDLQDRKWHTHEDSYITICKIMRPYGSYDLMICRTMNGMLRHNDPQDNETIWTQWLNDLQNSEWHAYGCSDLMICKIMRPYGSCDLMICRIVNDMLMMLMDAQIMRLSYGSCYLMIWRIVNGMLMFAQT
jgi:hypothetical protein